MSAGHYSILEASEHTVQIRNDDTNASVFVTSMGEEVPSRKVRTWFSTNTATDTSWLRSGTYQVTRE
jgi:hypothetical protein